MTMMWIERKRETGPDSYIQDVCVGTDIEGIDDMLVPWRKKPFENIIVNI
jgi:hypothetical protein